MMMMMMMMIDDFKDGFINDIDSDRTVTEHKKTRKHCEKHNTNEKEISTKVWEEVFGSVLVKLKCFSRYGYCLFG